MCRGTLAILVLVSYNIAVGNTFMVPEYGNNVYSIPPVERYDTDDITGRSSNEEVPPYYGTCWSISPNTIKTTDPTSYTSIKATGRGMRYLYDRNLGDWKHVNCYLFMASYSDQSDIEFQVDPEINENKARESSTWLAEMYGRIPKEFRGCTTQFRIIKGDHSQGAGGNSHQKSVMVHLDYAEDKKRKGNIEEVFLHEAAHACLDQHMKTAEWKKAMADDGKFISRYAKDYPTREDVSESSTSWYATRIRTDRQPAKDVRTTEATIPNRMNYFDKHLGISKENGCKIETGVYISGDVGNVGTIVAKNGQYECASKCASTDGCAAWTFKVSNSGCWLKSDSSSKGRADGWITGTKSCGEGSSEEVCMDIKKVTKAYGSENSWTFGKCKSSQQYASRQTYTTKCCLGKGDHTLTCKDSYGDGWHGGYLEIQGKKYCKDFKSGSKKTTTIQV